MDSMEAEMGDTDREACANAMHGFLQGAI